MSRAPSILRLRRALSPIMVEMVPHSVSRELRKAVAERGDSRFMAMWAGQGVGLFRNRRAAELVAELVERSQHVLNRLAGNW